MLGHCSVFTCDLQKFFFNDKELTWRDAQEYCTEHHSDLLTVYGEEDLKKIPRDFKKKAEGAWIGLQSVSVAGDDWQWSQPGVKKTDAKWATREPNNHKGNIGNCAIISPKGLHILTCSDRKTFLCYNGEDCYL